MTARINFSGCTPAFHVELRRLRLPQPETKNHRPWESEGLMLAECAACGSTLSIRTGEPAAEEAEQ